MMSAVLASRNESRWVQSGGGLTGKHLPSVNHLNPNPNFNPKKKKKKQFHSLVNAHHHNEDSPIVTETASDDAYSFNQRSMESKSRGDFNQGEYVSINMGSCNRNELVELKKRLVEELEQIQKLNHLIESGNFQPQSLCPQFYEKSKKLSGNKRTIPTVSSKDPKGLRLDRNEIAELMKMCRQVLTKLLRYKWSWIFKTPVDVGAMGLHDYHQIIKHPMDLGTVRANFKKNLYTSPCDFAADVRLTFQNAILYNPKHDGVHRTALQLLGWFEDLYRPIQEKLKWDEIEDEVHGSSWNCIPSPDKSKNKLNPMPIPNQQEESLRMPSSSSNPSSPNCPLVQSPKRAKPTVVKTTYVGKQPKPKARDPNKRPMSMEEKHRLGTGLQSLPEEKMPQLVHIIRKRNQHMAPEGDEIELDIEVIDTETLWELDRFVTNWKKLVSKIKRQALMVNNSVAPTASGEDDLEVYANKKTDAANKPKKGEAGEEDVDIGDEMPMSHFPPVEIEKDDRAGAVSGGHDNTGHATSSCSSSSCSSSDSSSSSSSGSDSGSSSGSDSDADDAESRGLESKEFAKT